MSKRLVLLLIAVLTASTLILAKAPSASAATPSIPEFTIKFEAHPYDVQPTYTIDPYTGETTQSRAGYTVKNESVVITITNQPFTPYADSEGNEVTLSFVIRVKGHYEPGWTILVHIDSTDEEYITEALPYGEGSIGILRNIPFGGEVDFQVEARTGYFTYDWVDCNEYFTGETSGWSQTQTLKIGESPQPSPTPAATPTPTAPPEQTPTPSPNQEPQQPIPTETIVGVAVTALVIGVAIGFLIYLIKKK